MKAEAEVAVGVTVSMIGGPATVHGPRALAAYEEFAAGTRPTQRNSYMS